MGFAWVGVFVPLFAGATEVVQIQRPVVAVDASVAGVLAHGFAVLAVVLWSGLSAGGIVVGVLRHPQTAVGTHVSWDLGNERGGHVDQRPYAGAIVDAVDEHADPVGMGLVTFCWTRY